MRAIEGFQQFRSGPGFVLALAAVLLGWVGTNALWVHFDVEDGWGFPLLNLLLSVEASFAMPVLLMAQQRAAQRESAKLHDVLVTCRRLLKNLEALTTETHEIGQDIDDIEERLPHA